MKSPRLTSSPDWEGSVKSGAVSPTPTLLLVRREPIASSLELADLLLMDSAYRLYRRPRQAGVYASARISTPCTYT
jgi:hypothetical protein